MVATKQGGAEPEPEPEADPIAGEWDVTVMMAPAFGGDYAEKTGTMVISGSNGSYVIESVAGETFNLAATFANNVLTAQKNGSTLTLTYDAAAGTLIQDGNEFQTWELPTTKSLVATKQGGAPETPEVPEEPEATDPWATAASFTNDGTGYGAFMKELKVYADETNMYVRLTVEKQAAYSVEEPQAANYLDMVLANGEGETQLWWGWTTPATKSYKMEHKGDLTEGKLTKMRWYHSPETEGDRVYVDYTTEEVDGNYVYGFTYPREWVNKYASSTGKIYVSFMLWNGWDEYWAIPQTGNSMLEVVLP